MRDPFDYYDCPAEYVASERHEAILAADASVPAERHDDPGDWPAWPATPESTALARSVLAEHYGTDDPPVSSEDVVWELVEDARESGCGF